MRFFFKNLKRVLHLKFFLAGCIFLSACLPAQPTPEPTPQPTAEKSYGSIIVNVSGQLAENVIVRVPESGEVAQNDNGTLKLVACGTNQHITAWAYGYKINTVGCETEKKVYDVQLTPIAMSNNSHLSWIPAGINSDPNFNCQTCHSNPNGLDEYLEWQRDGHASVFQDPYFEKMYLGSDNSGYTIGNTQWGFDNQGHQARVLPNPGLPYYGTGFKLDYPTETGNCVYCHAPAAAIGSQTRMDLTQTIYEARRGQSSIFTEGITCDICHKVVNVQLDGNKVPFPDKPGVLSYEFVHDNRFLFMGPNTDAITNNVPGQDFSCAPIFSKSEFCAPCHTAEFNGTQIYDSYGEWLASPYNKDPNKKEYKPCQACHMPPDGITDLSEAPKMSEREACSPNNNKFSDFNHDMMLHGDDNISALIKQAADLKVDTKVDKGVITVTVTVSNVNAGHKFPTDSPLRHLILVIEATTTSSARLPQIDGPTIPLWGGDGNTIYDYAGRPGEIYANILIAKDTSFSPEVAYWNPVQPAWPAWKKTDSQTISADTRILPGKTAESMYVFGLPPNGKATFNVKLIYRYAFVDLARQKGWPINDIIAKEETVAIQ